MWDLSPLALLRAQHGRLGDHLRQLWADRRQPCYLLEALGCGLSPADLEQAVRPALQVQAPRRPWWRPHALPLLVLLADVGYGYQGPLTKFWAPAEGRLGIPLPPLDREALSDLYEREAEVSSRPLARPPETKNRHIAWSLTHAVLPLDLQRDLVEALCGLGQPLETFTPEALGERLRSRGGHRAGQRYREWLRDDRLVHAVASALIGDEAVAGLDAAMLERVRTDLGDDELLERTKASQAEARRRLVTALAGPHRQTQPSLASLVISLGAPGKPSRLSVLLPALTPDARAADREHDRRFAVLGGAHRQYLRSAFSGVPLELDELPSPRTPVLRAEAISGLPSPLKEEVERVELDLEPPLVFEWDRAAGEDSGQPGAERIFRQVHERGSEGAHLIVLHETPPPADLLDHQARQSRIAGATAWIVQAASEALWDWLVPAAPPSELPSNLSWVGGPHDGRAACARPHVDDPSVWRLDSPASAWLPDGEAPVRVPPGSLVQLRGARTETAIALIAPPAPRSLEVVPVDYGPAVPLTVTPTGPLTVTALRDGTLAILVLNPSNLLDLRLTVELELSLPEGSALLASEQRIEQETTQVDLEGLRAQVSEGLLATLTSRASAALRLDLEGVVREAWPLGQDSPVTDALTQLRVSTRAAHLDPALLAAGAQRPWQLTSPALLPPDEAVALILPEDPRGGLEGGYCIGSPDGTVPWDGPIRPRLAQTVESTESEVGLRDLVRSYLAWTLATPTDSASCHYREVVVRHLDSLIVEITCGGDWWELERKDLASAPLSPQAALVKACRILSTPARPVGYNDDWITVDAPNEVATLNAELEHRLQIEFPDLVHLLSQPEEDLKRDVGELQDRLDALFGDAYVKLKDQLPRAWAKFESEYLNLDPWPLTDADDYVTAFILARTLLHTPMLLDLQWPRGLRRRLEVLGSACAAPDQMANDLSDWSSGGRHTITSPIWPKEIVLSAIHFWGWPATVGEAWRDLAAWFHTDKHMSRACRFLALRSKAAQALSASDGMAVVPLLPTPVGDETDH